MSTLFQALQNVKAQPAQSGQQSELQRIARARKGKLQQGVGPKASALGQQRAIAAGQQAAAEQSRAGVQTGQALQQQSQQMRGRQQLQGQEQRQRLREGLANLQTTGELRRAELGQQLDLGQQRGATEENLRIQAIQNKAQQQLQQLASARRTSTNELFRSFQRDQQGLATDRDLLQLHQAGFLAGLASKDYTQKLNQIGREHRLENDLAFKQEAARMVFGEELMRTLNQTEYQDIMAADTRESRQRIGQMDLDTAIQVATTENLASNYSTIGSGVVDIADAYLNQPKKKSG